MRRQFSRDKKRHRIDTIFYLKTKNADYQIEFVTSRV